ncbi:MAG: hydantoinase B/oxoprolinase family protein [Deltaproteobacteria bacterium]|nr:hydantoinase B/oxoprolinase family protein [Deltaproteobacteria bacterium]
MKQQIDFPPYDIGKIVNEIKDEELKKIPGALETGKAKIDPITFSVVLARAEGIMSEMTETILATARNPILYGAKDFTCTLLNAKAKVLFMFDCLPAHVGTLSPALRWVIRSFGDDIRAGEVFVHNASFAGNAHVGDWTMFAPVFYKGRFVVWAVNKCHLIDIGCPLPTTGDTAAGDIYQEGLHFPGVRLCRNHEEIPDIIRFIGYNFRYSKQWHGDFLAQVGSLWVAENRIIELCDRFGYDTVKGCFEETIRYGSRKMTEKLKKFPKITVEEEMMSEKIEGYCPDGVKLKVKLSIDPDRGKITFDYRDMPDQLQCSYNLTTATARCSAIQGTLPLLGTDIPLNDGALDHIEVLMRDGAIAGNPRWPVGTMIATTGFCDTISNLVFKAWSHVLPKRALAGMGEFSVANLDASGVNSQTRESYTHQYYLSGAGSGATEGYDGLPHMFAPCIMGNMGYEFIETFELAVPNIVWGVHAVTDSGGPGKWRGGVSMGQKIQPRDHEMLLIYAATGYTNRPFGLFDGLPGSSDDHWIVDHATGEEVRHLPNAGKAIVKPNEIWVAVSSGGGGFGDPAERDPEAVKDDVRDGFVSLEAARKIYKVVIDTEPELYAVDYTATFKLRSDAENKTGGK